MFGLTSEARNDDRDALQLLLAGGADLDGDVGAAQVGVGGRLRPALRQHRQRQLGPRASA